MQFKWVHTHLAHTCGPELDLQHPIAPKQCHQVCSPQVSWSVKCPTRQTWPHMTEPIKGAGCWVYLLDEDRGQAWEAEYVVHCGVLQAFQQDDRTQWGEVAYHPISVLCRNKEKQPEYLHKSSLARRGCPHQAGPCRDTASEPLEGEVTRVTGTH